VRKLTDSELAAWAQSMVDSVRNNAIWAIPATGCVYRFDHTAKRLYRMSAGDGAKAAEWFVENVRVFGLIGWAVVDVSSPVCDKGAGDVSGA
jgi:hypothetical protein